jgi:hypothetical protein
MSRLGSGRRHGVRNSVNSGSGFRCVVPEYCIPLGVNAPCPRIRRSGWSRRNLPRAKAAKTALSCAPRRSLCGVEVQDHVCARKSMPEFERRALSAPWRPVPLPPHAQLCRPARRSSLWRLPYSARGLRLASVCRSLTRSAPSVAKIRIVCCTLSRHSFSVFMAMQRR